MKILSKVKSIMLGFGVSIWTLTNNVLAITASNIIVKEPESAETLYGVYNPSPIRMGLKIAKTFVIPIILIIGLIIYFKKSKSSNKKKILVSLLFVVIAVILYIVINRII